MRLPLTGAPARRRARRSRAHGIVPAIEPLAAEEDAITSGARTPTVVFVPGIGLAEAAVRPTIERGAAQWRARVVRLPGYGDPVPPGTELSPERLADRLLRALDRDGVGDVVLVGHSASCQITAEAAARDERVVGLVLVGPTTDPAARTWPRLAIRWLRTAVHEPPWQVPTLARLYSRTGLRGMARAMEAARRHDVRRPLAGVTVPTAVVRGRHDRIAPRPWVDHSASLAGGRAVHLLAGGHMVVLTHPAPVAAVVTDVVHAAAGLR